MLPDWIELCASFVTHGVEFLVVGGQAVVAHGYPRMTKDLDLWVRPTRENGERIISALRDFGTNSPIPAEAFERPETMLVLGRAPFRVDLLTDLPGVTFEGAWARRVSVRLDGHEFPLMCRPDLIQNKKTVGRPQDLADVAELEKLDSL
jgi:hypothetical protein